MVAPGHSLQQVEQQGPFLRGEPCQQHLPDATSQGLALLHPSPTDLGHDDEPGPAVVGVWIATYQALSSEVVDDRDDGARVDAEQGAQVTLGPPGRVRGNKQHRVVATAKTERLQRAVEITNGSTTCPCQQVSNVVHHAGGKQGAVGRFGGRRLLGGVSTNHDSSGGGSSADESGTRQFSGHLNR